MLGKIHAYPTAILLPRKQWSTIDRIRTGHGRYQYSNCTHEDSAAGVCGKVVQTLWIALWKRSPETVGNHRRLTKEAIERLRELDSDSQMTTIILLYVDFFFFILTTIYVKLLSSVFIIICCDSKLNSALAYYVFVIHAARKKLINPTDNEPRYVQRPLNPYAHVFTYNIGYHWFFKWRVTNGRCSDWFVFFSFVKHARRSRYFQMFVLMLNGLKFTPTELKRWVTLSAEGRGHVCFSPLRSLLNWRITP